MALSSLTRVRPRRSRGIKFRSLGLAQTRAVLRIIGNLGLIAGQCVLLFISRDIGLLIITFSSLLSFPYFWHNKVWDVLVLMCFMLIINVAGLLTR